MEVPAGDVALRRAGDFLLRGLLDLRDRVLVVLTGRQITVGDDDLTAERAGHCLGELGVCGARPEDESDGGDCCCGEGTRHVGLQP